MLFKTVNTKIEKKSYDLTIQNIDLSADHWGSERDIVSFLDTVESFYLNKETFEKNIILHALNLIKYNRRVQELKFYSVPQENKLIIMVVSNVRKFKDFELFSRQMNIFLKREKFSFSVVEVLAEEYKDISEGKQSIPSNWVLNEAMTDRVKKLSDYV